MESNFFLKKILAFLKFETFIINDLITNSDFEKVQLAENIFNNLSDEKKQSLIDAIYFAGDYPFIYFRTITENIEIIKHEIAEIHRKIWNEGQAPLLFIISPSKISVFDCFAKPSTNKDELPLELISYNLENDKELPQDLKDNFNQEEIDTGNFWKNKIGSQISSNNRIDKKLLRNLRFARERLLQFGLSDNLINDLLGRCLFVFYLEDRNVPLNEFLGNYSSLFDILIKEDVDALYSFFKKLKVKFNGDLFPVTNIEKENVEKVPQILRIAYDCFYGNELNQNSTQQALWRIFDYKVIHIETISSVYEEFIHSEEEERTISQNGTFYTPKMLVDLILNELLPQPTINDYNYDIKILDPACGSGIFLVQAYKRLIERWSFEKKIKQEETKNNREILENILRKSIFGVELDPEAIKVAALSLYLALLDKLEPKEIWAITELPNLIYDPDNNKTKGKNLFKSNTFSKGLFDDNKLGTDFQLIIGNPPWKRGKLDIDVSNYLSNNNLPQEIVAGYLHLMPETFPDAKIGLVTSAKVFFNSQKYENLQNYLFRQTNIQTIFNLSLISENKLLFSKASQATFALIYSKNNQFDNKSIVYCIPKPSNSLKNLNYILIDNSDIKYIPKILVDLETNYNELLKIVMYGSISDYNLIRKIKKSGISQLSAVIDENNVGIGLHAPDKIKGNEHLKTHKFIEPTKSLERYTTFPEKYEPLGDKHNDYRPNNKNIFISPVILVKEGLKKSQLCASFIDFNCAYLNAISGIKINESIDFQKALVVFLNSKFAMYYLFLTNSSFGVDRRRIQLNDLLELPALPYHFSEESISEISTKFDKIVETMQRTNKNPILKIENDKIVNKIENEIEKLMFSELKKLNLLNDDDKILIDDLITYSLDWYLNKNSDKIYYSIKPTTIPELKEYSEILLKQLSIKLQTTIQIEYYNTAGSIPLKIITINLNKSENSIEEINDTDLNKLLNQINKYVIKEYSESIYFRREFEYYENDTIFLIKPNEKKFWSKAQAISDSEKLFVQLASKKG